MSEKIDSKFKKLEMEYAHLLKYFSYFEKTKRKFLATDNSFSQNNENLSGKESKLFSSNQLKIIEQRAKDDLKLLSISLKKLEAYIKHSVDKR